MPSKVAKISDVGFKIFCNSLDVFTYSDKPNTSKERLPSTIDCV